MFTKVNSKYVYYVKLHKKMRRDIMRTFIERLRGLREDSDLTQQLGTSQTMYARYERGANEMPLHHLVTLCRFYNVSADYLLNTYPVNKK